MANARSLRPFVGNLRTYTSKFPQTQSPFVCQNCLLQQHQQRSLHRSVKSVGIPSPTPFVPDVSTLLSLIGRGLSAHASKFESWDQLFTLSSSQMKELGVEPARTRRYLLNWLQKFRRGEYGIGGDFKHVENGIGELRVVEVPAINKSTADVRGNSQSQNGVVSISQSPGMIKLVLNVRNGDTTYVLEPGETTADLKKAAKFKIKNGRIAGPHAQPIKGSNGAAATVKAHEGMWEYRRGQKVFGGERRRAETLHKMAVAEHRKNTP